MAVYRYKARNKSGSVVAGRIRADNLRDVEVVLQGFQQQLISYRKELFFLPYSNKIHRDVFILIFSQLSHLLEAGVPLLQSLTDLQESQDSENASLFLQSLVQQIESGAVLSSALEHAAAQVPSMSVAMIRAGEQSGNLAEVLEQLSQALVWQKSLSERLRKAVFYPLFSGAILASVCVFLMIYLVPSLVSFIQSTANELPWYTRWLIATSDHIADYIFVYLVFSMIFSIVLKIAINRSRSFKYFWSQLQIGMYYIGPMVFTVKVARFAYFSSMLYSAGITILSSLETGKTVVDNMALEKIFEAVIENIREGGQIGESFMHANIFPLFIVRMLSVGEKTGAIDRALMQISHYYRNEAERSIDRLEGIIGPVLIMIIGLFLLWIIIAVIGPIYDAVINLGGTV